MKVKAKKYLGQHFLKDLNIAEKIANTLTGNGYKKILEIGPGTGVLTQFLLEKSFEIYAVEIDKEAVRYLEKHFIELKEHLLTGSFLDFDFTKYFGNEEVGVIGNFPYNISTQIVFKILENKTQIPEATGMFQKEVAQRITATSGNKTYGILSVLTQTFYEVEYLFTVPPKVFIPQTKVNSGVIRLVRKTKYKLPTDEKLFFKVVKTAFQQRRKTLRNSLKPLHLSDKLREDSIFALRPEQLSPEQFIYLTQVIKEEQIVF